MLMGMSAQQIKTFVAGLLEYFERKYPEIGKQIIETTTYSVELKQQICKVAMEYKEQVNG